MFDALKMLHFDIYRVVSVKLVMIIELLHSRSHLHEKLETSVLIFSQISQSIWVKFGVMPQAAGLSKLMLHLFHKIDIQGREPFSDGFIRYALNIGLHQDPFGSKGFKLGMMLDTTKVSLISV